MAIQQLPITSGSTGIPQPTLRHTVNTSQTLALVSGTIIAYGLAYSGGGGGGGGGGRLC